MERQAFRTLYGGDKKKMQEISYSERLRLPGEGSFLWKENLPLLTTLDLELTERCNNNCIHCSINLSAGDSESQKRELSTREIEKVLQEAASLGCLSVRFTGGEPLLRDDFQDLYMFARRLGLRVVLFTNATLITPELARRFAHFPPLEPIEVTVYGMKKESYEAVSRVPGSYRAFRDGVERLLENNIPFVVKGALLPPNKEEIEAFEAWAATLPWMEEPPRYSLSLDLRCRRDSAMRNRRISDLRLTADQVLEILMRRGEGYWKELKAFCSRFIHPSGERLFPCGAGIRGGCVDAYGHFQPCLSLRHPETVYDLKQGCLTDALTNFFPTVRAMKASNPDYLARCARCFLKALCEQCPAKSWMEHGTLDTPVDYLCDIAHAKARHMGLLEDEEVAWEVGQWKGRIQRFLLSEQGPKGGCYGSDGSA